MKEFSSKTNRLLAGLSAKQIIKLLDIGDTKNFKKGQTIIHEGDKGESFFLITSGAVDIYKEKDTFKLARLGPGDEFGLMASIEKKRRNASVKSKTSVTVVEIKSEDLNKLDNIIAATLIKNSLLITQGRLRESNEKNINLLKKELLNIKKQQIFAKLFISVSIMIAFYAFIMRLILENFRDLSTTTFLTAGILIVYIVISAFLFRNNHHSLKFYGLTFENSKAHLKEAFLWTIIMIVVTIIFKLIYIYLIPAPGKYIFLDLNILKYGPLFSILIAFTYIFFTFAQEFIARGLLQGSLQQVLTGPYAKLQAIVSSSLIFSAAHLHLESIYYAIFVFIPSLFWGALYAKQKSLVGVTFSHAIFGFWMTEIMGFGIIK